VRVDGEGRFTVERTLPSGLAETITYDGTWLYHRYAELGLATRRRADDIEAVLFDHWLPFRVPSAQALSRWYHVSATEPRTLRLSASRAHDAAYIEIAFDEELRVIEVRTSAGGGEGPVVARRFEHKGDILVFIEGDQRTEIAVSSGENGAPGEVGEDGEGSQWALVDIPLRQPAYWIEQAANAAPGHAEWRRVQRQLLASHAALGQHAQLWQILQALAAHGEVTLGELVLASGSARAAPGRKAVDRMIASMSAAHRSSAPAQYFALAHRFAQRYRGEGFAELARRTAEQRSLIAMLSRYRGLLLDFGTQSSPSGPDRRAIEFIGRYPSSPLSYIVAHGFSARWSWQAQMRAVAVWDAVQARPWADIARFEAARVLYQAGKYDQAAERFERLFAPGAKTALRVDGVVAGAFTSSSRGRAGWRKFWIEYRERLLAGGDPARMPDLVYAALQSGEHGDLDRVVARASQLELRDPGQALAVADALMAAGQDAAAMTVLRPWLEQRAADSTGQEAGQEAGQVSAIELRASLIAERQGRHAEAAALLVRAMERDPASQLAVVRGQHRRLIGLHTRAAQSHAGSQRQQAVASALRAVAGWRALDPANPELDSLAATLLYSIARPEEAWRYLSTIIEHAPMEGESYRAVADVLEREGRLDQAEPLWQRAAAVDPTNPTWLFRRAQTLSALGKSEEARALLAEITSRKWHERFAGVVSQARNLAKSQAGR
jgi:tetratricopeptide (TPR) repeat protein